MSIFTTDPERHDGNREVIFVWELGPATNFRGEPCTATAQLSIFHDGDRKRFLGTVTRVDQPGHMFTIGKGTSVSMAAVPCPRYSAKALDAAVVQMVTELLLRKDEPEVQAVADPASPA